MLFDGRPLAEISDAELSSLFAQRSVEDQFLEYKAMYDSANDDHRMQHLYEVCAFANADGGYIIIGIQDDGEGRPSGYVGIDGEDAGRIEDSLRNLCTEHISPRIEGLEVRQRTVDDRSLVVVRIPASARVPHMVTYRNRTAFRTRIGESQREMSREEIRSAFLDDPLALSVERLESKVAHLLQETEEENTRTDLLGRIESGTAGPILTETENGHIVADIAREQFEREAGTDPYFWIAATPVVARSHSVPVQNAELQKMLRHPPGSRPNGWNMEAVYERPRAYVDGLVRGDESFEQLRLAQNGHCEFRTPLSEHFCWKQSPEEFARRPRLYPYPVVEYPVTFLRLYRHIKDDCGLEGEVLFQYEYRNLRGYILRPYHPRSIRFTSDPEPEPFPHQHYRWGPREFEDDFVPDETARLLLSDFYTQFGWEPHMIPFHTEDEGFAFG